MISKDFIDFLNNELEILELQRKKLSRKKNNIQEVYNAIYKNNKLKKEGIISVINKPKVLETCLEETCGSLQLNIPDAMYVIKTYEDYLNYVKEIKELDRKAKINLMESEDLIIKHAMLTGKTHLIDKFLLLKKNGEQIKQLAKEREDILDYILTRVINEYNNIYNGLETIKDSYKKIKSVLYKIKKEELLSPKEYAFLLNLIENEALNEQIKSDFLNQINSYTSNIRKRQEEKAKKESAVLKKTELTKKVRFINYKDDEPIIINEISIFEKYLNVIKFFDNFNDISNFLNSLKENFNIETMILNILNYLKDTKEDELLKKYLLEYLNLNKNNEEIKEDDNIVVLYYNFIDNKNIIKKDIELIPFEHYGDVINALDCIKNDGGVNKAQNITSIKKVLKLRNNSIRITYKRLDKNVYIIYGIFMKVDNKGYKIIEKTRNRNKLFSQNYESELKDAIRFKIFSEEIIAKNKEIEERIYNILNKSKEK